MSRGKADPACLQVILFFVFDVSIHDFMAITQDVLLQTTGTKQSAKNVELIV